MKHAKVTLLLLAATVGLMYWYGISCNKQNTGRTMIDIKKLDEAIEITDYNPAWPKQFAQEAATLKAVFAPGRLLGLEHYGSTAVPGLKAKPIVDILVGLDIFKLTNEEKQKLAALGYAFVGQLHPQVQRFFLRKRGVLNVNLGVVVFGSDDWFNHLITRDYLRSHPDEVQQYAQIKDIAIRKGYKTLIEYHRFKDEFVKKLNERAKAWK